MDTVQTQKRRSRIWTTGIQQMSQRWSYAASHVIKLFFPLFLNALAVKRRFESVDGVHVINLTGVCRRTLFNTRENARTYPKHFTIHTWNFGHTRKPAYEILHDLNLERPTSSSVTSVKTCEDGNRSRARVNLRTYVYAFWRRLFVSEIRRALQLVKSRNRLASWPASDAELFKSRLNEHNVRL